MFVSLHVNAYDGDPSINGLAVFYPKPDSFSFAQAIDTALAQTLKPFQVADDGVAAKPELWVRADVPTVTVEPAYLTNPRSGASSSRTTSAMRSRRRLPGNPGGGSGIEQTKVQLAHAEAAANAQHLAAQAASADAARTATATRWGLIIGGVLVLFLVMRAAIRRQSRLPQPRPIASAATGAAARYHAVRDQPAAEGRTVARAHGSAPSVEDSRPNPRSRPRATSNGRPDDQPPWSRVQGPPPELEAGLRWAFQTENDMLIFPASGTGGLESAVANIVRQASGCSRSRSARSVIGLPTWRGIWRRRCPLDAALGETADPEDLDALLSREPDIATVLITHNETSTGVTNRCSRSPRWPSGTIGCSCRRRQLDRLDRVAG